MSQVEEGVNKLLIKTPQRCHCRSGVFIVDFEHILHLSLMFLLLNLNKKMLAGLTNIIAVSVF